MCPNGYFDDGLTPTCSACDYQCKLCQKSSKNCVECAGDRLYKPKCECKNGYFDNGEIECKICSF